MMLPERLEGHGIRLRDYGRGSYKTICPRCSAQRRNKADPCLSISIDDEGAVWKCHHCAWSGGVKDAEYRPQARRERSLELKPLTPPAIEWFRSRGISDPTLRRAGVAMARHWIVDREVDCIAFPYIRHGRAVNCKFRPIDRKSFAQIKGGEARFYLSDLCHPTLSDTLTIVEGELDALACLEAKVDNVVSVPSGAPAKRLNGSGDAKFAFLENEKDLLARFARIVIAVDADGPGMILRDELLDRIGRERCAVVSWPKECKDANDVLMRFGPETLAQCIDTAVRDDPAEALRHRLGIVDAKALLKMEFPPLVYVVDPYLVEGATVLASRPKVGKSWAALNCAIGVARGRKPFDPEGAPIESGDVLYLALEDTPRRLQNRMRSLLQGEEMPEGVDLVTEWRRFDNGGLEDLRDWLTAHKRARLVVIDTLQKVRPPSLKNVDAYAEDYALMGLLKKLADAFHVAILIVHHTKKAETEDFVDALLGSSGITGAADTVLVLKRERGTEVATLRGVGRDVHDVDDALRFERSTGIWTRLGEGNEYRQGEERREVVEFLRVNGISSLKDIAEGIGKPKNTAHYLVGKLIDEELVLNLTRGKYGLRGERWK